jgi:hypothetical protein
MSRTPLPQLRVFAFKDVVRFVRKFRVSDDGIWRVVHSRPDADPFVATREAGDYTSTESRGQERALVVAVGC